MENLQTGQLLRRCAHQGNEQAWSQLIQRFGGELRAVVRSNLRQCGERPTAEGVAEALQEVYCQLLDNDGRHLRNFRGVRESELSNYLARITESVVRDLLRRRRALKRGGGFRRVRLVDKAETLPDPFDTRYCPERQTLARDQLRVLFARYRSQGPSHRQERNLRILLWSLVDGRTSREIAAALPERPSPSSVNSLLYRLRKRLASLPTPPSITSSSLRRTQHAGAPSDRTS